MTRRTLLPSLIMAVGTGWLMTILNILPGVDWLWVILLAAAAIAPIALFGIDAATFPTSLFLLTCTFASLLRQTGRLHTDIEVPILVIAVGAILFLSRLVPLKRAQWLIGPEPKPRVTSV